MPNRLQKRCKEYRFSLIELLTVIAVITVLMGMSIGVFSYVSTRMAETRTRAIIAKIESALENYKTQYGYYLTIKTADILYTNSRIGRFFLDDDNFNKILGDFETLKTNDAKLVSGRYYLVDYFGNDLFYRCPGYFNRTSFDIGSIGSDSVFGAYTGTVDDSNVNTYWGQGDDITNFTRK